MSKAMEAREVLASAAAAVTEIPVSNPRLSLVARHIAAARRELDTYIFGKGETDEQEKGST